MLHKRNKWRILLNPINIAVMLVVTHKSNNLARRNLKIDSIYMLTTIITWCINHLIKQVQQQHSNITVTNITVITEVPMEWWVKQLRLVDHSLLQLLICTIDIITIINSNKMQRIYIQRVTQLLFLNKTLVIILKKIESLSSSKTIY